MRQIFTYLIGAVLLSTGVRLIGNAKESVRQVLRTQIDSLDTSFHKNSRLCESQISQAITAYRNQDKVKFQYHLNSAQAYCNNMITDDKKLTREGEILIALDCAYLILWLVILVVIITWGTRTLSSTISVHLGT